MRLTENSQATNAGGTDDLRVQRLPAVCERFQIHRSTLWRWCQEGHFPQPIKLSPGVTVWRVADINRWLASKGVK